MRLAKITAKGQRMPPAIFPDHSHRKVFLLQFRPKRIVVRDRCNAAEKVAQAAPPKANLFGNRPMDRNEVPEFRVDVLSPVDVIRVGRIPQPWKERKLQMVVRIDEARQDQKPAQIYMRDFRNCMAKWGRRVEDTSYAIAFDPY
jgi:hypothetical protein